MLTVINFNQTLIAYMNGNTLEDVFQSLKVSHNAYHKNKNILRQYITKGQTLCIVDRATYLEIEQSSDLT